MALARDFAHYAEAAYNYSFLCIGKNVGSRLKHFMCQCGCGGASIHIEGNSCLGSNVAAIRAFLPHLDDDSIIHISFVNREEASQLI